MTAPAALLLEDALSPSRQLVERVRVGRGLQGIEIEREGIGRAAMTQMLDGLAKARWVERPHPEDRRKIAITLSKKGRRRLEAFLPGH